MTDTETIAAIATPPGYGGVGIVRVSGKNASKVAEALLGQTLQPRIASYTAFLDAEGEPIDKGIALFFKAPHSFTGEDVLELHGHGGPVVLDMLMQRILALGVTAARAGEFSERAFLNNKIDLTQAEAIADLIAAESQDAARAAMHSLQGEFSAEVQSLVEKLIQLRIHVESALDFPEEEIDFLADKAIAEQLADIQQQLSQVKDAAQQGKLLREGMTVVIAGEPNAGKSSLLNYLAGEDAAIVTDIPGTTRDILRTHIQIDGLPLHIIDTAGLRESSNVVEQEGIRRAWHMIEKADRILFVVDNQIKVKDVSIMERLPKTIGTTYIINKIDLSDQAAAIKENDSTTEIYVSAKTGEGIDLLKQHLKQRMGYEQKTEGRFIARRRHLEAIDRANDHLIKADHKLHELKAGELLAEELRQAQQQLSSITGEFSSDDLLGRIFADFCIGK